MVCQHLCHALAQYSHQWRCHHLCYRVADSGGRPRAHRARCTPALLRPLCAHSNVQQIGKAQSKRARQHRLRKASLQCRQAWVISVAWLVIAFPSSCCCGLSSIQVCTCCRLASVCEDLQRINAMGSAMATNVGAEFARLLACGALQQRGTSTLFRLKNVKHTLMYRWPAFPTEVHSNLVSCFVSTCQRSSAFRSCRLQVRDSQHASWPVQGH